MDHNEDDVDDVIFELWVKMDYGMSPMVESYEMMETGDRM